MPSEEPWVSFCSWQHVSRAWPETKVLQWPKVLIRHHYTTWELAPPHITVNTTHPTDATDIASLATFNFYSEMRGRQRKQKQAFGFCELEKNHIISLLYEVITQYWGLEISFKNLLGESFCSVLSKRSWVTWEITDTVFKNVEIGEVPLGKIYQTYCIQIISIWDRIAGQSLSNKVAYDSQTLQNFPHFNRDCCQNAPYSCILFYRKIAIHLLKYNSNLMENAQYSTVGYSLVFAGGLSALANEHH